ncbi:hypothetical protein ABZ356_08320 [Micromonospora zamorensis]|uniref:hypothetical protein n=1 Tax=Micromonospora zamorensis TaxID=709883 RepID=UPI0033BBDF75
MRVRPNDGRRDLGGQRGRPHRLAVIERDKLNGPAATVERIYTVPCRVPQRRAR